MKRGLQEDVPGGRGAWPNAKYSEKEGVELVKIAIRLRKTMFPELRGVVPSSGSPGRLRPLPANQYKEK